MKGLSDIDKKVIETAMALEKKIYVWQAPHIQFHGWPDVKGYKSKELWISASIQNLIRKGFVRRAPCRAGYFLSENVVKQR